MHVEQYVWGGDDRYGYSLFAKWGERITNPVDWLNTTDPSSSIYRCQEIACDWNGSWQGIKTLKVIVPRWVDGHSLDEDGLKNGVVTFHGWQRPDDSSIVDSLAISINTTCTGPSARCAPLVLNNVPLAASGTTTLRWNIDANYSGIHPQDSPRIRSVDTSPGRYGITDTAGDLIWWIEE